MHKKIMTIMTILIAVMVMGIFCQEMYALDHEVSKDFIRSRDVRIEMKGDDCVIIGERRFIVNESTKICDKKGNVISLEDISVPCDVTIWYNLIMDKDPVVTKIITKKIIKKK